MYIFYKISTAQAQLDITEESFLKLVESDFNKAIQLFNKYESWAVEYKIYPKTKAEAKWMIFAYCSLVKSNQPIPKWLINYIYSSFENILNGNSANKSLGLTNPPHRPKESYIAERNKKIYNEVKSLMQNGINLFEAALEIAENHNLHESTIQNIYSALKHNEDNLSKSLPIEVIDF